MNLDINKGFIFAGCSFTHGYGLQYYHTKEHLDNLEYEYNGGAEMFRRNNRFASKVSNHFNTWYVTREGVSGNDLENIAFIKMAFQEIELMPYLCIHKFQYEEISDVIIQTTYVDRVIDFNIYQTEISKIELEEDIIKYLATKLTYDYKQFCLHLESKGIRVHFIHATSDFKSEFEKDEYLHNKTIYIEGLSNSYFCINDLMSDGELANTIYNDTEFFGKKRIKDYHPSLVTHNLIADSIIKKLSNERN
jgi:hypothetical protein